MGNATDWRSFGPPAGTRQDIALLNQWYFNLRGRVEAVVALTRFRWLEEGREGEPQPDKEELDRAARERDLPERNRQRLSYPS